MAASSGTLSGVHSGSGSVITGIISPRLELEISTGSKVFSARGGGSNLNAIKSLAIILPSELSLRQASRNLSQKGFDCFAVAGEILERSVMNDAKKICSTPRLDITSENAPPDFGFSSQKKLPAS